LAGAFDYLFINIVLLPLLFYKRLLILQAIIKPLADDEKNIPAFSEKKKKQTRFQIKNGDRERSQSIGQQKSKRQKETNCF